LGRFRALSDRAGDPEVDSAIFSLAREDGTPDLAAAVRYALTRPWRIPLLIRLGRDSTRATRVAAAGACSPPASEAVPVLLPVPVRELRGPLAPPPGGLHIRCGPEGIVDSRSSSFRAFLCGYPC
jgi:hypothetical protein